MSENVERVLGRIESKLDAVHEQVSFMKEDVEANTRFRWRATAIGSAVIALLGWLGIVR